MFCLFCCFPELKSLGKVYDNEMYVETLAIYPKYRGKGLSVKLLKYVENMAKKQNIKYLTLDTDPKLDRAVYVYKKFGFKIEKDK